MKPIKNLLIDLDDTLIPSGHTYYIPQLECATILTKIFGINSPSPITIIRDSDIIRKELMAEPGPIPAGIFAQSWILYYTNLCSKLNLPVDVNVVSALGTASMKWLQEQYYAYPGVVETLKSLSQNTVICTLGTDDIQRFKVETAGLTDLVDAVEVMDTKNITEWESILKKHKFEPSETAVVGDNKRLDIHPNLALGLRGFYIHHPMDAYNHSPDANNMHISESNMTELSNFNEIIKYL